MIDFKRKYYRDTFNGKLLGVCAGFEDYWGADALWFRLGAVVLIFTGFGLIIPLYFIIAMITPKKPPEHFAENLTRTFSEPHRSDMADEIAPATRKGIDQ